jgi:hypothetical protein
MYSRMGRWGTWHATGWCTSATLLVAESSLTAPLDRSLGCCSFITTWRRTAGRERRLFREPSGPGTIETGEKPPRPPHHT